MAKIEQNSQNSKLPSNIISSQELSDLLNYVSLSLGFNYFRHFSVMLSRFLVTTPSVLRRHNVGFEKKSNAIGELFVDSGSKFNGEHESEVKNVAPSEFGA